MKVVLVGPVYPYRGGIAHYTARLADNMIEAGHEVEVISFSRQYPAWLYPGKTDRDPSSQPIAFPARYILDSVNPLTWLRAAGTIARSCPDLVLIMWWSTFWAPADWVMARLLRARGLRVAYLIHNVLPHEARFYDRFLGRLALNASRNFLVQTSQQHERLCALVSHANIIESTHPVYDMFSGQRVERTEARFRLGLPPDGPVLLFFGIVRPYKGLPYLLEAVQQLKARGKTVHLLVAGEFWEPEAEYRQRVEQMGLADIVHITNRYIENEEVPLYFSAADMFVAPYVGGTQSGTINIALSFGLPIVMTVPISESIPADMQRLCEVVAPGDASALAGGIEKMLERNETTRLLASDGTWLELIASIEKLQTNLG